ncbi:MULTISPECIES: MFS transporter [Pseudarthrobacter]|jgi:MFS transporter, MHS family, proline/betaine transporter|uniref:Putative proline/betaine transporter n=1 Tax=Pseudarthrobacter oxydans TaxID=1671 RepID=A0AAW8NAT6_PSEOX|nr:MFS transporter [Pseudarthrobacter oxydans]MDV2980034.1 MFS transporter [Actinomycetes bacterium ARC8]WHP59897.1 MFS transporter [Arthrobacter sp. KFRI-F3372]MDR6791922.1 MHS family proline/betaine transporter-like MFS transporter [Pseudarthrobacter oxydans]MDR7163337.1 MHS family proline/betaine transporter-like MFS transporter [Pseudarthrobacter oxydans]NSX38159.1 MFS transporter [Pseudarthrobacter oxydans]
MPTDRSVNHSSAGLNPASGTNPAAPPGATSPAASRNPRKPKILARRRLKESDVNVVDQPMLKKALGGTIVGNTMEWYDVGVFGYLITTMGPVFLPESDPTTQTLFLLGTFAATFIARPLGGVIFGWLGDKMGRQKVLAATLMLMAASTFAIGLLPGYAQIGLWAAGLLVLLKIIQGFSTGGEYAGATTFVSEYSPDKRRGFFASFLDLGSYMGFAIGAALVSVLQLTLGQAAMEEWGWRIPFLIAGPLGLIAVYFRSKIEESPQFQATLDAQEDLAKNAAASDQATAKGPVGIVKAYWRSIIVAMVLVAAANTAGYALTSYMPTYLTESKGYDPVHGTLLTIPVLVVMSLCIPLTGKLSDRIGRRPVLWIGAVSTVVLAIPAFMLIGIGEIWSTLAGLALIAFPVTFYVANLASALPAQFPTSSRYGAMGIAYNFSVAIFGGTTPFIVAALIGATGNDMMPAYYLMATSLVGAVAIYFLKESAQRPLPGSMPSVDTQAEARELVATQDENPLLNLDELPFDEQDITDSRDTGKVAAGV